MGGKTSLEHLDELLDKNSKTTHMITTLTPKKGTGCSKCKKEFLRGETIIFDISNKTIEHYPECPNRGVD